MRIHFHRYALFVSILFTATQTHAEEQTVLNVYGDQVRAVVIAAPKPKTLPKAPKPEWIDRYDQRLRRALAYHGALQPLDRNAELPDPTDVGLFDGNVWRATGADILLRSSTRQTGNATEINVYVYDVADGSSIFAQRFRMVDAKPEALADAVAGKLVETLLGISSPFDTDIVFRYRKPGSKWKEIYVTDWTGKDLSQRTSKQRIVVDPVFVPGGQNILAVGYRAANPTLTLFDFEKGLEVPLLQSPGSLHGATPLPDGSGAIFSWERRRNTDLYKIDFASKKTTRLTTSGAADLSPTVSPDGKKVAFISDRRGNPYLYELDLETKEIRPLLLGGAALGQPEWSPDGKYIALLRKDRGVGGFSVWTVTPKSGIATQISQDYSESLGAPSWAPDSRTIIYSRLNGNSYDLWKVDRAFKQPMQVTTLPGDATDPNWQPKR